MASLLSGNKCSDEFFGFCDSFWFSGRRNFGLIYVLVDEEIEIETTLLL